MAKRTLVDAVADEIAEALAPAGFQRRALSFRLVSERGDTALVQLQKSRPLPGEEIFYVNTAMVPAPWWAYMSRPDRMPGGPGAGPDVTDGLLFARVQPPPGFSEWGTWTVRDAESASRTGRLAGTLLVEDVVPRLRRMLDDRTELVAEVDRVQDRPLMVRICLLAEVGLSPQLDVAIRELDESDPHQQRFAEWAYAYAQRSSG